MKHLILDSSGWIEILQSGPCANELKAAIEDFAELFIPVIVLAEVRHFLLKHKHRQEVDFVTQTMLAAQIVPVNADQAIQAADFAIKYKISLASSLIYTVANEQQAMLWTLQEELKHLPDVRFFTSKKPQLPLL